MAKTAEGETLFLLKAVLLSFFTFWYQSCIAFNKSAYTIQAIEKVDSVFIKCDDFSRGVGNWMHDDTVLYVAQILVNDQFEDSLTLFENYSLLINPVSISHEGIYRCIRGTRKIVEYLIDIKGLNVVDFKNK